MVQDIRLSSGDKTTVFLLSGACTSDCPTNDLSNTTVHQTVEETVWLTRRQRSINAIHPALSHSSTPGQRSGTEACMPFKAEVGSRDEEPRMLY